MIRFTVGNVLDNKVDKDLEHSIYVIRNEKEILYVGLSRRNVLTRVLEHLGRGGRKWMPDLLGQHILDALPDSRDWQIEFLTVEDCEPYIKKHFPMYVNWDIETAERAMIWTHDPVFNIQRRKPDDWPPRSARRRGKAQSDGTATLSL